MNKYMTICGSVLLAGFLSLCGDAWSRSVEKFSTNVVHGLSIQTNDSDLRSYAESLFVVYSRTFTGRSFLDKSNSGDAADIILFAERVIFDKKGNFNEKFLSDKGLTGLEGSQRLQASRDCVLSVTNNPSSQQLTYWGFIDARNDVDTDQEMKFKCVTLLLSLIYGLDIEKVDGATSEELIINTLKKNLKK